MQRGEGVKRELARASCTRCGGLDAAPPSSGAIWLWSAAVLLGLGCAPSPSTVPLGLGPLAVAEKRARDAEASAAAHQKPKASAAPPSVARAPAAKLPAAESEPVDESADEEDPSPPSAGEGSSVVFEGLFAGSDVAIYRLTGFPEREERDDKAKIRIEKASGDNVGIILINSADGSDLCELVARVEGNAALIESAQPCFSDGSEGSLEAELTSGRAVLDGDRLKMDAEGTLSVSLPDQDLDGQLTYTFEGKRQ